MALRIQGKHFASKSELIIDPFPELQTTLVRAKSQCSVRGRREEVARQDIMVWWGWGGEGRGGESDTAHPRAGILLNEIIMADSWRNKLGEYRVFSPG